MIKKKFDSYINKGVVILGTYTITVLPGDGIGTEVTAQATRVLQAIGEQHGHTFTFHHALVGLAAIKTEGAPISEATLELCQHSDAILLGAVGGIPQPDAKIKPEQALFRLRKGLQFFANLRPVRTHQALLNASTIKPEVLQGT